MTEARLLELLTTPFTRITKDEYDEIMLELKKLFAQKIVMTRAFSECAAYRAALLEIQDLATGGLSEDAGGIIKICKTILINQTAGTQFLETLQKMHVENCLLKDLVGDAFKEEKEAPVIKNTIN